MLKEVRKKLKNKKEKELIYLRVNVCKIIPGWLMHIIKTTSNERQTARPAVITVLNIRWPTVRFPNPARTESRLFQ